MSRARSLGGGNRLSHRKRRAREARPARTNLEVAAFFAGGRRPKIRKGKR